MERAGSLPPLAQLAAELEANAEDLGVRLNLAIRLIANDDMEQALEHLLAMLKQDRNFEDEVARKTMIKVFELLGKGNELATEYRRKMFTFLH